MSDSDDETSALAVDMVLLGTGSRLGLHVLLIRRAEDCDTSPGHWALPGGYVQIREALEAARDRELYEETGLTVQPSDWRRVGWYAEPYRDPRGRVVSFAFLAIVTQDPAPPPRAGDDAAEARWVLLEHALGEGMALAFDHEKILRDALTAWVTNRS